MPTRTLEQRAELRANVVRLVLAGAAPREAAVVFGISENYAQRIMIEWRKAAGLSAAELRTKRIAARLARREGGHAA